MLGRKQSIGNDEWVKTYSDIESIVSKQEIDILAEKTLFEIVDRVKGKSAAYAWSGGKDSIVLGDICKKAGITMSVIGICNLEYPAFLDWIEKHKPEQCKIVNTGQDIEWLAKHQDMLFPQESKKAARWFSIVQHTAQCRYYKDTNLDIILLGRRKADGNYVGNNGVYTDRNGIMRYSPLAEWSHEHILAYIHYFEMELPPIYAWKNGYLCGTHPWAARQWTDSIENGWKEVFDIDSSIVVNAANYIESAKVFLQGVI